VGVGGLGAGEACQGRVLVGTAADDLLDDARVVGGLRALHRHAGQAGGLPQDGVGVFRVGQVVVEAEPQRRAGTGRAAGGRHATGVEVPLLGVVAGKLDGAATVQVVGREVDLGRQPVVDRHNGDAGLEAGVQQGGVERLLAAAAEAAAVDEHYQRCRRIGLGLPQVE